MRYKKDEIAAEMLYQKAWNSLQDQSQMPHNIMILEKFLEAYFGDTLCARRLHCPLTTTKEESMGTNISNSGGKEVDMPVSSVMNDTENSDFESDFENLTAVTKIPIHVPPLLVKSNRKMSASFPGRSLNMRRGVRISSAFELPIKHEHCQKLIRFNFAGANPMSKRHLKRRILDPQHAQLMCQSVYFSKSCQVECIGKLVRRHRRATSSVTWLSNMMATL
ncbi:uncharacterized protein LOC110836075 isoform X2 [Zootermopsis nevadensis]|uniref:uncharacterized protein LOC110836075 isoform X2 n=1 Tax=Zootermopsis nevadensis TaxID=136037 RepID=UPI000B8EE2BA|nr:uncharacterized protein LOC110836075 isoform X2 [Zootermopsis nevadensis]